MAGQAQAILKESGTRREPQCTGLVDLCVPFVTQAFHACARHGPAFGTGVPGEPQGERLVDRLAAAGRRCVLVDRQDMLTRHVTGADLPLRALAVLQWCASGACRAYGL